jgi:sulfate/thiosulfate transport system permease protein
MRRGSTLPGFGLSLGITLAFVGLLIVLPLAGLVLKTATLSWSDFVSTVTSERALASYRLTFGAAFVAASINATFGFVVAWVLVRYRFPGRAIVDALVDLPFALPTAVAGLTLTALYARTGVLGGPLADAGILVAFTPLGVIVALTFIGLPFVVRTVQPVMEHLDRQLEEAAAVLGASRWQTFTRVLFPSLLPALLCGFALSLARAIGEYGSIVFISGNMPLKTEITPLLIVTRLEQYDYAGATALAVVMLAVSFALLLAINVLQRWSARRLGTA